MVACVKQGSGSGQSEVSNVWGLMQRVSDTVSSQGPATFYSSFSSSFRPELPGTTQNPIGLGQGFNEGQHIGNQTPNPFVSFLPFPFCISSYPRMQKPSLSIEVFALRSGIAV